MNSETTKTRLLNVFKNVPGKDFVVGSYVRYFPRGEAERVLRSQGFGLIDFYPAISLLAPAWHTHEGYISGVNGAAFRIEHTIENGGLVETRSYHTPIGTISQVIQKDPQQQSDWTRKFYITEEDDYRVTQYVVENTVFRPHHNEIASRLKILGEDGVLLARLDRSPFQKILVELSSPERFLMDMLMRSPAALSLLEALRERLLEQVDLACASPAELIWQPDNLSGDMTPPDLFQEFVLPFYEEAAQRVRNAGKVYVVHMDGRLKSLKSLIASSAVPVIESFSLPDVGGDMTFEEACETWNSKVIIPNFPSSWCEKGDEEIKNGLISIRNSMPTNRSILVQISEDLPHHQWQRVGRLLVEVANSF